MRGVGWRQGRRHPMGRRRPRPRRVCGGVGRRGRGQRRPRRGGARGGRRRWWRRRRRRCGCSGGGVYIAKVLGRRGKGRSGSVVIWQGERGEAGRGHPRRGRAGLESQRPQGSDQRKRIENRLWSRWSQRGRERSVVQWRVGGAWWGGRWRLMCGGWEWSLRMSAMGQDARGGVSLVRGLWMFLREMCLCLEVSSLNRPVEQRGALYHGVW